MLPKTVLGVLMEQNKLNGINLNGDWIEKCENACSKVLKMVE